MANQHMTLGGLRWWYGRINRRAFAGRLPNPDIRFGATGDLAGWCVPEIRPVPVVIDTADRTRYNNALLTLIHEMVHIAHPRWVCGRRKWAREVARVVVLVRPECL